MTTTQAAYLDTLDQIRAIYDQFPEGVDPDFDSGLSELECQLVDLRFALDRH
jgi:hypothetical protein